MTQTVAALFVRSDSHYKTMAGVEAYDMRGAGNVPKDLAEAARILRGEPV